MDRPHFYYSDLIAFSNIASTSAEGFLSMRETIMHASRPMINPGTISYIPVGAVSQSSHIISTKPPTIIPARAPLYVRRFQYTERTITGPKAEPKPAHALPTKSIMDPLPGIIEIINAATEMITTNNLPTHSISLSDAFFLKTGL